MDPVLLAAAALRDSAASAVDLIPSQKKSTLLILSQEIQLTMAHKVSHATEHL